MVAITESTIEPAANVPTDVLPATSSSTDYYEGTVTDDQASSHNNIQLISTILDVRAFCHVNLMDARIQIVHENSGSVVLELKAGSSTVLFVRCHLDYLKNRILINSFSYSFAEPQVRVTAQLNDHCHLHLHVFRTHYAIELNGQEVLHFTHRLPFHDVQCSELHRLIRRNRRAQRKNRVLPY